MREGPVQKLCNRDTAVVSAEILYIIKRGEEEGQGDGGRRAGGGGVNQFCYGSILKLLHPPYSAYISLNNGKF